MGGAASGAGSARVQLAPGGGGASPFGAEAACIFGVGEYLAEERAAYAGAEALRLARIEAVWQAPHGIQDANCHYYCHYVVSRRVTTPPVAPALRQEGGPQYPHNPQYAAGDAFWCLWG